MLDGRTRPLQYTSTSITFMTTHAGTLDRRPASAATAKESRWMLSVSSPSPTATTNSVLSWVHYRVTSLSVLYLAVRHCDEDLPSLTCHGLRSSLWSSLAILNTKTTATRTSVCTILYFTRHCSGSGRRPSMNTIALPLALDLVCGRARSIFEPAYLEACWRGRLLQGPLEFQAQALPCCPSEYRPA